MVVLSNIAQIMDPRDGDFDWSDEHGKPATLIKTCERCGKVIKGRDRYCKECSEDPMMATFD
ncbi:MAG: hypothetical protein QF415_13225 [Candidatus Undinarchaeales archaeon]|jgi:uncharacterized OB-fold protein|nr:hypothetical protein [Candidatus Undinarchaeales archaeon]MDP7493062.1 hypothetical protein [Candidatus Undinarchaeales archaeon]